MLSRTVPTAQAVKCFLCQLVLVDTQPGICSVLHKSGYVDLPLRYTLLRGVGGAVPWEISEMRKYCGCSYLLMKCLISAKSPGDLREISRGEN